MFDLETIRYKIIEMRINFLLSRKFGHFSEAQKIYYRTALISRMSFCRVLNGVSYFCFNYLIRSSYLSALEPT